jgi:NADH-quinone oxidoreductase subunit G
MPGTRSDLEIILQLARMVAAELTESGKGPQTRAELGESRGVQSGEVDQQAVWMRAQRANLRISRDDPDVVLGEIQRALPGYQGTRITFHGVAASSDGSLFVSSEPVQPYDYDLFSSPFYGRHSATLHSVMERRLVLPGELPQEDPEEDGAR